MQIKLTFLGAAQNVTGSRYLVEANNIRFLVDCGLYQERELRGRNWEPFPAPPQNIDAVLLTHAHLDHCGLLPKLVHEGFHGPIYCTAATAEIAEIMLLDSANIQQEDAEFKKRRHKKERGKLPIQKSHFIRQTMLRLLFPFSLPLNMERPSEIGEGVEATFYDAGHVLGSS